MISIKECVFHPGDISAISAYKVKNNAGIFYGVSVYRKNVPDPVRIPCADADEAQQVRMEIAEAWKTEMEKAAVDTKREAQILEALKKLARQQADIKKKCDNLAKALEEVRKPIIIHPEKPIPVTADLGDMDE